MNLRKEEGGEGEEYERAMSNIFRADRASRV